MKYQLSPPAFTIAPPVDFASMYVSYVQWIVLGLHCEPVRSAVAAPELSITLFFSRQTVFTASATEEVGTSTTASTRPDRTIAVRCPHRCPACSGGRRRSPRC